ncbi:carotenoid biosynthesis protein [Pontibacter sp. SGAir0037]|uniref:carotenoid biosynthesis protein n=1 Tax=Pontibacter sp. SGAir0037 TaxID=2571030 RepID=UPI0010CD3A3B|nr:carotenoid biosynthesis protein [Pontibacter sp. SGAir0037]QCR23951.1 carotenoid biosynthesis protein [Pontibacter sp. SGAir0037]
MPQTDSRAITATKKKYAEYFFPAAVAVLVIFHAVGLWGLAFSGNAAYFQSLTPLNLLLTNAILFSLHKQWNLSFIVFAIVTAVTGFMAEVVGVHTALLFGYYTYGEALGTKLWEVPLLIGLNWLMLVYTTGHISNYTRWHWLAKCILGAALMVLLDYFIEPVAVKFDFWSWTNNQIPVTNFTGWFGIAFLLQICFQKANFQKGNKIAPVVFFIQAFFFISLFMLL